MGNSSSRSGSSLSHTAVGGSSHRRRSRDSQVRERPALRPLSAGENVSAVTSATAASSRVAASSLLAGSASPTRGQHRDAAAEALTASAGTQDNHLVSPVSSTHQHGLLSLSSLPTKGVVPSPARATAAAVTVSQHSIGERGHPLRDSRGRDRSCDAELSLQQRHHQQQRNKDFDLAVIDAPNSCQAHGDDENANGGAARRGSVVSVHRARSSSTLQAATDSAAPLPLTTLLSLEDTHLAATKVSTAPTPAGGHTRGTVSMKRGGDTEVNMNEHNTDSSQVCRAVSPSTLIRESRLPLGSPAFSCPPSTAASPPPVGRAARSTNVPCHPSSTTTSTATPQQPDEPLNLGVKGAVGRGSCNSKSDLKSKPEGAGDGRSERGGFWRRQSRNLLFRKLLSRSGSRAERPSLPSRPTAAEDGGSARGTTAEFTAEEGSFCRSDITTKAVYQRTSPAQRAHDVRSTASAAVATQPRSSSPSSPFPAVAAAATGTGLAVSRPLTSSMTAQRVSAFQSPAAGGHSVGRTTVAPRVDDARSPRSGSRSPRCADDVSGPKPSGEKCHEALPRGLPVSKGTPHFLQVVPGEQVGRQDSKESDSTTPTASFAEAVWGTRRAATPATSKTATDNTSLFSDDDHDNDHDSDCLTAAASPSSVYYSLHQQPRQLKAPGVLGAGSSSITTVTDTTARVSPRSPFVSPLTAVAAAESGGSAAAAAFSSSAATADACLRGRRSVSQSAIIAAWNRLGARTGAPVSGVGAGGGHHGGVESPEPSAEALQMSSVPGKSLAVAGDSIGGDDELATSAVPASRDTQLARVPTAAAAEVATDEAPSFRHQCTVAGHQEAGNRGSSRRSCAGVASVLPIRGRSVTTRQREPPPPFSPSPENSEPSDAVPQPLSALGQLSIREGAPAAGHPASPPAPTKAVNDIAHGWVVAPPQELHRPPRVRIKYKEEAPSASRASPLTRELPASLHTSTATSTAIATQWPSSQESRGSDTSLSTAQSLQVGILVPVNVEDRRSGGGLVEERERLLAHRTTAYDEEMMSETATTVDADEEDRANEEGGAAERHAAPRSPQSLAQHQLQRQPIEALPHRASTPRFTTTRTTVAANSAAPDLLSAHYNDQQHYSPPHRMTSGTFFAPSTSGAAACGAILWVHSSPSSPRSCNTSDSRLEAARGAQNVEDEEDSIEEVGLRRTRDSADARRRLHRSGDEHAKRFVGLDVSPFNRNYSSPSVFAPRRDSTGFNAMAAATRGGGGTQRAALVRSNSYQPLSRRSQLEPTHNTSLLSSTARAMPRWRERWTPTPQPTSPLSWSAAGDDIGGTASGLLSTPRGRRGLTSQGAPPLARQPSAHLHYPLPPPISAVLSHVPQYLRREISGSLGSVRWQEVSLHTSGGRASPNLGFAGSSRDNDDTPPHCDALGDDEEDLDAVVNEDDGEDGGDDGAQRRQGCPVSGAVGEDTGDDGNDTFLCLESSEAPTSGMATLQTWHRDDADDDDEEDDKGDTSENGAGSCSNGEVCSDGRHCLRLPQRHRCRRPVTLPSASTQLPTLQPQESCNVGGASREFDPSTPSEQGISPSRTGTRTFGDAIVRLPQTRYEPPMPSNRNTFTAFVHLSDISSSQLLATAAAGFQCGPDAHLRGVSTRVHGDEAAAATSEDAGDAVRRAGPHAHTPATAATLILNNYALRGAHLADGAGVGTHVVDATGGALPISPLNSSLGTAPTDHISRADTPALVAVHGAVARRTSQGAEAEAASTRSESPGSLSCGTPPKLRRLTKAPQGLNHAAAAIAAAAVGLDGSSGGFDGDNDAGSDDLSVPAAQPGATSPRTSWSLESRASAAPVSEGERHALSDEERPWLDVFGHSTPLLDSVADAAVAVDALATVDGHLPQSAPLSASQPLPWWNRHRHTTRSEGSGTLDFSQRGGESGNGGGGHSPCSSLSVNSALAVVPGGRAASPASPATSTGSVAITGSPLGHTLHPGGGAVASVSFRTSGGRVRREAQYPTIPANGCRSSAFSSSSGSTNSNGGDAAHSGAASAALRHKPNGEVLVMQGRSCDAGDSSSAKRVAGEEGIAQAGAAPLAERMRHDHAGLRDACMQTWKRHPWMPVFPSSSRSATMALAAETARAEFDSKGVLDMTAPAHAMTSITVVPSTLSFIEAEVQSLCNASPLALAIAAASGGSYCGEGESTSDKEALDDGVDGDERSDVDVPAPLSLGVQAHHSRIASSVSNTIAAPTNTAVTAALDGFREAETYARTCVEESATDARGAGVSVRDTLPTQHRQPLLRQQCSSTTAPFVLTSALPGMGMMASWASETIDGFAGGAGPGSGCCSGSGNVASISTALTTATSLAVLTSRVSCDSLVSPSQTSELALMPRRSGDAADGNGGTGTGTGPGPLLMDERVSGVEAADSSAVTGAHAAEDGDAHYGRAATHTDAGLEVEHELPHPPLATKLIYSHFMAAPHATLHRSVDTRSAGFTVGVDQRDTGLGEQIPLTMPQNSPTPSQPTASCTAGPPGSPNHVFACSPLLLDEEASVDTRAASRAQARPDHHYGLVVAPLPHHEGSTPRVCAQSRSQRQHRGPSIGQIVCRWCGEPYTSAAACLAALRPHSVLRKERRIEKAAKRTAQTLLREGRVTEAVALLKSAGVYVQ
ncbi:hypothetical protein LMJF_21_0861 [Leishmania major strain Friedlin]|uniref:Uncharacterized protein n=1 Tax=Leishmania major TaxID=5664 RepID=Q4QCB9_LEIMA|nr:hypothetical protein LMJF_21_0861 [Leishmania major strain Friedlin]CAG9573421.1 hypothetical_protein_-_conserved [Leishmania major strain Friedlin]CAJ04345.1 hypothetical protein LMJF_21_0861 [Leishmania major strain Friedlin]|eukprot:XP_001683029.1 hypothetical protein LMJF_21_0861 [Leishmania major strain Friedlin]